MSTLQPTAERWRGALFRTQDWQGVVEQITPGERPADTTVKVVWRCKHRHASETDAAKCAAVQARPRRGPKPRQPRRGGVLDLLFGKGVR